MVAEYGKVEFSFSNTNSLHSGVAPYIAHLFDELAIGAELEVLDPMEIENDTTSRFVVRRRN